MIVSNKDTPQTLSHRKCILLSNKPLLISKQQLRRISKGMLIRLNRKGMSYILIGLKGSANPLLVKKCQELERIKEEIKAIRKIKQ